MQKAIKVLYEDEHLVVFDKPSGLLSIPTPKNERNTLIDLVNQQYAGSLEGRLHPCHRLDRDTSGAILFAKGKRMQQLMRQEFEKNAVRKIYIAFVRGRLKSPHGEIKLPVEDYHQRRYGIHSRPKPALTAYHVKREGQDFSVVEVFPRTGRTNQIRIHFQKIGHPLLGERLYAFGRDFPIKFRRVALHASELSFHHPVTKKTVKVASELPEDMRSFLEKYC